MVNPLVSIVVITYNSGRSILETLESAASQNYQNIELVISDDRSTDDTVEICRDWLKLNGRRFVRSKIVTTPGNTGVSANLNRGVLASVGRWIKPIAGDDALASDAIKEFVNFSVASNAAISVSRVLPFGASPELLLKATAQYDVYFAKLSATQAEQRKRIFKELYIPGPGMFFSRDIYNEVEGFDENYPFCEEWPFFLKILTRGYRIEVLDKALVKYRINELSLCRTGEKLDRRVFESSKAYFIKSRRKLMIRKGMFLLAAKHTFSYYAIGKSYETESSVAYRCYVESLKIKSRIREILARRGSA